MQVPDIHAPRYKRIGECVRCGQCCLGEDCPHLMIGDGKATCAIFGQPNRPSKCTDFPYNPPIVFKNCGYSFLDLWEDGKVVKGKV